MNIITNTMSTVMVAGAMAYAFEATTATPVRVINPVVVESTMETAMRHIDIAVNDREMISIAREVVASLVDDREYMGCMVQHAKGLIADDDMEVLTEEATRPVSVTDDELRRKVFALAELVGHRIDSELVSAVFHCDYTQSVRVLASWRAPQRG